MFTKLFRIGNDPVIRFTKNGDAVLGLSLAYAYGRKGEDGKRPTQWLDGSLWGKQAEALAPYLMKGNQISATLDDLHIEEYEGKNGKASKLAGRIVNIELVSSGQSERNQVPSKPEPRPSSAKPSSNFSDMEDDFPPF
jgi:single-strand DNA-binding protein